MDNLYKDLVQHINQESSKEHILEIVNNHSDKDAGKEPINNLEEIK